MKNKDKFLGMPHGTATHRLRKSIMFNLIQKCGEDVCYVCKEKIETVDELSIEHKQPWENISVDLFWDLDNIAFSHLHRCNKPHVYNSSWRGKKRRIEPPTPDLAWCSSHKGFESRDKFDKGLRWDGLKNQCKECRSKRFKLGLGR